MAKFEKGNKKAKGRPKGSQNKKTTEDKQRVKTVLSLLEETLVEDIKELTPSERVKTYTTLLEYELPKLQRVSHTGADGERLKIQIEVIDDASDKED